MTAFATSKHEIVDMRNESTIVADALTRIPTAHFRNKAWAAHAIATGAKMISDSIERGDKGRLSDWMRDITHVPAPSEMMSVLSATCEAIVANAFQAHGDIRTVTAWITEFEQDGRAELTAAQRRKDVDAMNDSDRSELAAGLVRVVQMHDKDTATHLAATAALAKRIAIAMDLAPEVVTTIELAARLHDVGKVAVRTEILRKPDALTAEEWREMRLHCEAGASVLSDTPKLADLAPIVRAHHERIDGYGYPDRLRGDEIPLEARVVSVADAFHAMTTERPYRRAMMPNDALAVLVENADSQFDANVVAATLKLFRYAPRSRRAIA